MKSRILMVPDVGVLVTLAEAVERESRARRPVVPLLDDLDETTRRIARQLATRPAQVEPECVERWRRVVASVRRDVVNGRVRSVSGIAHEARRFLSALEAELVERDDRATTGA